MWVSVAAVAFLAHTSFANRGSCTPPALENGVVQGNSRLGGIQWVGNFSCNVGYSLVGVNRAKCMNGMWSSDPPVCAALGACSKRDLPQVKFARLVPVTKFRGAVHRYRCRRGYKRYGQGRVYCNGQDWNLNYPPICARAGCDEESVARLHYGRTKSEDGAVYRFHCEAGAELLGPSTIWCDGRQWNDTKPICQKPSAAPVQSVEVNDVKMQTENEIMRLREHDSVTVTCSEYIGNPPSSVKILLDGIEVAEGEREIAHTFVVDRKHFWRELRCSAQNLVINSPLETVITLIVEYESDGIAELSGPDTGHQDTVVPYRCLSKPGYPAPKIVWDVFSYEVESYIQVLGRNDGVRDSQEGQQAWSDIQVQLPGGLKQIHVHCSLNERNSGLYSSLTTEIYSPTSVPILKVEPTTTKAGEEVKVECRSNGGNPPPSLRLTLNGAEISDTTGDMDAEGGMKRAAFVVEPRLNGANIECSAINTVMREPRIASASLQVQYAPDEIEIAGAGSVRWGEEVELACHALPQDAFLSTVANPAMVTSWSVSKRVNGVDTTEQVEDDGNNRLVVGAEEGAESLRVGCTMTNDVSTLQATKEIEIIVPPPAPVLEIMQDLIQSSKVVADGISSEAEPEDTKDVVEIAINNLESEADGTEDVNSSTEFQEFVNSIKYEVANDGEEILKEISGIVDDNVAYLEATEAVRHEADNGIDDSNDEDTKYYEGDYYDYAIDGEAYTYIDTDEADDKGDESADENALDEVADIHVDNNDEEDEIINADVKEKMRNTVKVDNDAVKDVEHGPYNPADDHGGENANEMDEDESISIGYDYDEYNNLDYNYDEVDTIIDLGVDSEDDLVPNVDAAEANIPDTPDTDEFEDKNAMDEGKPDETGNFEEKVGAEVLYDSIDDASDGKEGINQFLGETEKSQSTDDHITQAKYEKNEAGQINQVVEEEFGAEEHFEQQATPTDKVQRKEITGLENYEQEHANPEEKSRKEMPPMQQAKEREKAEQPVPSPKLSKLSSSGGSISLHALLLSLAVFILKFV